MDTLHHWQAAYHPSRHLTEAHYQKKATNHFADAKLQNSRLPAAARVAVAARVLAVQLLDVAIQPLVTRYAVIQLFAIQLFVIRYAGIHPVEDQSQNLQCWRGSQHS